MTSMRIVLTRVWNTPEYCGVPGMSDIVCRHGTDHDSIRLAEWSHAAAMAEAEAGACMRVLIVSTGKKTQCSATPAAEPATMWPIVARPSPSSANTVLFTSVRGHALRYIHARTAGGGRTIVFHLSVTKQKLAVHDKRQSSALAEGRSADVVLGPSQAIGRKRGQIARSRFDRFEKKKARRTWTFTFDGGKFDVDIVTNRDNAAIMDE